MSTVDCAETVRGLSTTEVNKLTAAQLKRALNTIIAAERQEEPTNSILLDELKGIKEDLAQMKEIKQEVEKLSGRLDEAYVIIHQQQMFLESLDAKERRRNLVITGVKEETDDLGETDGAKIKTIIQASGYTGTVDPATWAIKRLGLPNDRRQRPIHVQVTDQDQRNDIVRGSWNLKQKGGQFVTIYIKKDLHPASRREMARIKKREKEEKEKPENVGVDISYDWRNRVLLRNGVVIDRYFPSFAMVGGGRQN